MLLALACGPTEPPADVASTSTGNSTSTDTSSAPTTAAPTSDAPTATATTEASTCGETFDPTDCGEAILNLQISPTVFVFVLEKSVSMISDTAGLWDHDADDLDDDGQSDLDPDQPATPPVTRWSSLHLAVDTTLTNFDGSLLTGLALFPSAAATLDYTAAACPVDAPLTVPIAAHNAVPIVAAMPPASATDLKGASPGAAAIAAATLELTTTDPTLARHIVYITDGAANCRDGSDPPDLFEIFDTTLLDNVAAASTQQISTHVLGIAIPDLISPTVKDGEPDNVNTRELLNQLATLGGAALPGSTKFHLATRESDLLAALDTIARSTLSCVVPLDPVPVYPELGELTVNGVDYGPAAITDCARGDGWRYLDAATIELCGQACHDFQQTGDLDLTLRCPPRC